MRRYLTNPIGKTTVWMTSALFGHAASCLWCGAFVHVCNMNCNETETLRCSFMPGEKVLLLLLGVRGRIFWSVIDNKLSEKGYVIRTPDWKKKPCVFQIMLEKYFHHGNPAVYFAGGNNPADMASERLSSNATSYFNIKCFSLHSAFRFKQTVI